MKISSLMKLATGSIGPDQLAELLAVMGMEMHMQNASEGQRPTLFQSLAKMAVHPSAQVMYLRGQHREGDEIAAILVVSPKKELAGGEKLAVNSGGRALEAPGEPQSL